MLREIAATLHGKPILLCEKHNVTTVDYCGECLKEVIATVTSWITEAEVLLAQ